MEVTSDGQKRLSIQWQERKGHPVLPPQRRSFGSIVVERMALQISDSSASLKYISAGVIWYLEAPFNSYVSPVSSEFGAWKVVETPPADLGDSTSAIMNR